MAVTFFFLGMAYRRVSPSPGGIPCQAPVYQAAYRPASWVSPPIVVCHIHAKQPSQKKTQLIILVLNKKDQYFPND